MQKPKSRSSFDQKPPWEPEKLIYAFPPHKIEKRFESKKDDRVTRLPTPKSHVQVNINIFDDCIWAGDVFPGTHFCEISSYSIRDSKCHFKVYCMFCFLMKGTSVCCRNMFHHYCCHHSLSHSVLPELFHLPIASWLSSQLEELSLWTLCSSLQLIAYYFSHGRTKVNFFGEVFEWDQNARLQVVAIIRSMDANNVKALKLLGATRWKPFFKFQNQDIVTHHLKCTSNLFLKYGLQLEPELIHYQFPVTAKWKHILNVYQWDKQNIVCLIYKPTDTHLFLVAQDAMKISLAALVMSHTVRASQKRCSFSK